MAETVSARILSSVEAQKENFRKVSVAIISVFDKAGIDEVALLLHKVGVKIVSTGGTFKKLEALGVQPLEVTEYTGFQELFNGRVKTLHPKIQGGILYCRGNALHEEEAVNNNIEAIDLVITNLYPFEQAISQGHDFLTCVENIDIGGPCMIRAAAKNSASVTVISSPDDYQSLLSQLESHDGCTTLAYRRDMARKAFRRTAMYDMRIAEYMESFATINGDMGYLKEQTSYQRTYSPQIALKYGCNPHQSPAAICSIDKDIGLPFIVLNGSPGYINFLDAALAFQLVNELKKATNKCAAASYKHCSPAGAALGRNLTSMEKLVYEVSDKEAITLVGSAYILARNSDPMCSFGDFVGVSDEVDEKVAEVLKREVSDGIIAPSYTPNALELLRQKKGGKFVVLKGNPHFTPPELEFRETFGMGFLQKRNSDHFDVNRISNVVSELQGMEGAAKEDLLLASICLKYTQSNSVGYAKDGQMIGVGAGQQSRVDCVKLAARKVSTWYLRQHPKVLSLAFKAGVKRQDRVNLRVRYIEGDFTETEYHEFCERFEKVPDPLTSMEKELFLKTLDGVSLSSDAFFPFRDSIDHASKVGVKYVAHPGGSVQDPQVTQAANGYGMVMVHTGLRAFLH